ncbi:hypothetical protein [Caldalkalibacillus mannanilyticus]|uniref:hypothetical protein n=1 Tax=Caldalkalibacillus mannanilyticus TaxID=1418 RepID=UPI000467FE04|nr:hypothetical protein [Caldalkalibacillus mannanilyticus]
MVTLGTALTFIFFFLLIISIDAFLFDLPFIEAVEVLYINNVMMRKGIMFGTLISIFIMAILIDYRRSQSKQS